VRFRLIEKSLSLRHWSMLGIAGSEIQEAISSSFLEVCQQVCLPRAKPTAVKVGTTSKSRAPAKEKEKK